MICVAVPEFSGISYILKKIEISKNTFVNGFEIIIGLINNEKVLFLQTGYGKINMSCGVQSILAKFPISTLIGSGDCASLCKNELKILDVAISYSTAEFDVNFTALGYKLSLLPHYCKATFNANKELIKACLKSAEANKILAKSVKIISGDEFVANTQKSSSLSQQLNALALDVECGALGQISYNNKLPYVLIKGISNYADDNAVEDYNKYSDAADYQSAKVCYTLLKKLTH